MSSLGHGTASDGKQLSHDGARFPKDSVVVLWKILDFASISSLYSFKFVVNSHKNAERERPNIQTYALCTFTFSLQTFTIFFRINAFINVYYNFFDVYHIYGLVHIVLESVKRCFIDMF